MSDSNILEYLRRHQAIGDLIARAVDNGAVNGSISTSVYDRSTPVISLRYDGVMPTIDMQAWQLATDQAWEVREQPYPSIPDCVLTSVYLKCSGMRYGIYIQTIDPDRARHLQPCR